MATRRKRWCDCIEKANDALAYRGEGVRCAYRRDGREIQALVVIEKERVRVMGSMRRARPATLVANYCPFCGLKYSEPVALAEGKV